MFRIDQVGLPTGTLNVSRTDGLANGAEVTLTYVGTGSFRARLLWVPPGDTGTPSTFAEASAGVWKFTPTPSSYGTYRIEGIENEGLANERRVIRLLRVRLPNGVALPAFGERANFLATLVNASQTHIDQSEDNAVDYAAAALNAVPWAGSYRVWHETMSYLSNLQVLTLTADVALLSLPATTTGGRVLPTVEQADGVAVTTGTRYLYPFGTVADGGGLWLHNGTILVRPSDEPANTAGRTVLIKKGRHYHGRQFVCNPDNPTTFAHEPVWKSPGMPSHCVMTTIAASGSQGWVTLAAITLPTNTKILTRVRVIASWRNSVTGERRLFDVTGAYRGITSTILPVGDPLRITDPGELETQARFAVTLPGSGVLQIDALRASSTEATNFEYDLQLFIDSLSDT